MRQRLFVEAVAMAAPLTGVGRYTERLLVGLLELHPDLELVIGACGDETLDLSGLTRYADRIEAVRNKRISRRRYRILLAAGMAPPIERLFRGLTYDAALFPAFATFPRASSVPALTIVHDATARSQPEDKSRWSRGGLAILTQRSLDSERCATVSISAAREIAAHFRLNDDLEIVYPICPAMASRPVEREGFVLCVGTASPRKNVDLVLRAKELLGKQGPDVVIVGMGHSGPPIDGVHFAGFVDDVELARLRSRAKAVVAPSFEEGFDMPVAEAVAAWVPVLASRIDVHEEVLGADHPYFFDCSAAEDLAELMGRDDLDPCDPALLDRFTSTAVCRKVSDLLDLR